MTDNFPQYSKHEMFFWGAWFGVVLAGFAELERRGMKKRNDGDPTLTAVISRYIPGWLAYAGFGALKSWLAWHFDAAYSAWRLGVPPDIPR